MLQLLEEFQAFNKKFYVPNNAVLVVAGDIDVAEVKGNDRKLFWTDSKR